MKLLLCVIISIQLLIFDSTGQGRMENGPLPEKCLPRADILDPQCCIFPPFFSRKIANECGAYSVQVFVHPDTNVTERRRANQLSDNCVFWKCIMIKYYLINTENLLMDDKLYIHLDKWVDLNPPFAEPILNAKIHCKILFRSSMPLNACEFSEFIQCIRDQVNVHCPIVIQTPACLKQKEFYDECKQYYSMT